MPTPSALVRELESLPDDEARHRRGIEASVGLVSAVLEAGAPGLHIYTFNQVKDTEAWRRKQLELLGDPDSSSFVS